MHKITAVALNLHDHNVYDGKLHKQMERYTRFKHNLPYHAEAYDHDNDKLNTNDYKLNDEFVNEYFKVHYVFFMKVILLFKFILFY